ncbi:hypothetical protein J2S44_003070 [Catenuloplanes niger]|uniref:Uncharacterized protein n=1 Tax=Catenuloplanes niger TaxID=587534 RepID=A0AAE3ZQ97_9ACTN|nr:hypothetical protein [Catenuloplanes niger]
MRAGGVRVPTDGRSGPDAGPEVRPRPWAADRLTVPRIPPVASRATAMPPHRAEHIDLPASGVATPACSRGPTSPRPATPLALRSGRGVGAGTAAGHRNPGDPRCRPPGARRRPDHRDTHRLPRTLARAAALPPAAGRRPPAAGPTRYALPATDKDATHQPGHIGFSSPQAQPSRARAVNATEREPQRGEHAPQAGTRGRPACAAGRRARQAGVRGRPACAAGRRAPHVETGWLGRGAARRAARQRRDASPPGVPPAGTRPEPRAGPGGGWSTSGR